MWFIVLAVLLGLALVWWGFFHDRVWARELMEFMKCIEAEDYSNARIHLEKARNIVKDHRLDDPRTLIVRLEEARMAVCDEQIQTAVAIIEDVVFACTPDDDKLGNLQSGVVAREPKNKIYTNVYSRALLNLAEAVSRTDDDTEAEHLFKLALQYRENKYGRNSRDVAMALNRYADFLLNRGRMAEAKELFDRAEQIIGERP